MASDYQLIEEETKPYRVGTRTNSAAQLAWFLETVWRIEPEDVSDYICDGSNDKGIDGLLVHDDLREITVVQCKYHERARRGQGDSDIQKLVGAGAYFKTPEAVDGLLAGHPNDELRNLLERLTIRERIADGAHVTQLVFVTNALLDANGRSYVDAVKHEPLDIWSRDRLAAVATRTRRPSLRPEQITLTAVSPPATVGLGADVEVAIGIVPSPQLVALPGIADFSIFSRNVRLSEGKTRINKSIAGTIETAGEHRLFPAYHNGLTVLTHKLSVDGDAISLDGIGVVNGCQSLLELHRHRDSISDELRLLVKVVQVGDETDLADKITYRSNNQNPVDIRDQRSTDSIQRDLEAQVKALYSFRLGFAIRQGQPFPDALPVLDNQTAAQFIMAIYVKEPWIAVRKVRLFDHEYRRIFTHHIDAPKLLLIDVIRRSVDSKRPALRSELQSAFASVRLTVAYLLSELLRQSDLGERLLEAPQGWLPERETDVRSKLDALTDEVVKSVNYLIKSESAERAERGEPYDPKIVFKNQKEIERIREEAIRMADLFADRVGGDTYWFHVPPRAKHAQRSRKKAAPAKASRGKALAKRTVRRPRRR